MRITIHDLEVFYHVGVPDEERLRPQRLLLQVDLEFDFTTAAGSDELADTINYYAVAERLRHYGAGRSWRLIEKLAVELADLILAEFRPRAVTLEVKKFPLPAARLVSVTCTRRLPTAGLPFPSPPLSA